MVNLNIKPTNSETLFLGIDGGGSKCKAKLVNGEGLVLGRGLSGRANPVHGLTRSFQSIEDSALSAVQDAGLDKNRLSSIHAGIGLAGINIPSLYDAVAKWNHPFGSMSLTTDLHIACLGAHGGEDGAVIITGTGSCGISMINGEMTILGAHGFPIGDQGSGAWIGLNGITAALLDHDQLGPKTALTGAINDFFDIESHQLAEAMLNQPPKQFAKLAPVVFQSARDGDEEATKIVSRGAAYINNMARKFLEQRPPRVSLLGGLGNQMSEWLDPEIRKILVAPLHEPEDGALLYAYSKLDLMKEQRCVL